MAVVSVGTDIRKTTLNTIVGAINHFNDNVVTAANNNINYWNSSLPYFSGTAYYGRTNAYSNVAFSNPNAIEQAQLAAKSSDSLNISDSTITASNLWSAMVTATRNLVRLRRFSATWYHRECRTTGNNGSYNDRNGGSDVLKASLSGNAAFNASYPAPTAPTWTFNGVSRGWTRGGNAYTITITPTSVAGMTSGTSVQATTYSSAATNCYNSWYSNCISSNNISYVMYSCHLNCHDNCHTNQHSSRNRR